MAETTPSTQTYAALLASIKERIQTAQVRAAVAVNHELSGDSADTITPPTGFL
jgi:hypothetical protein